MTAVEFLVNELNKEMGLISFVTGTEESYKSAIFSIIQQAKAMEKENQLDLIRFLRTQDKMGKSVEDLLKQFKSE